MSSTKPMPRRAIEKTALAAMLSSLILLTACATGTSSSAVQPTLYGYTDAFQKKAAEELESMPPACRRNVSNTSACSAVGTLVQDYGVVRAEIRAIKD